MSGRSEGGLSHSAAGLFQTLRTMIPGGDSGIALAVLFLLSILILPLPRFLLDMALALSFVASILILLVSLSLERPAEFSSLPTLLLLTTILRLSLNVATARLILSHGSEGVYAAGHVVAAFGGFLMGGDLIVGAIIFLILSVVNFIVITKGSGRIAEVAARFYLESMPGKQLAIDSDLSSGTIDDATARRRRSELSEEAGFYGAMDGASKFVRGDAISSLIITAVNIGGGLLIGLARAGMSLQDALSTFTTLTVGDGLVSQIPALLISTATGIVVSKGATLGRFQKELLSQLGSSPNALVLAAAASGILALIPGLPSMPFLVAFGVAGFGAWRRLQMQKAAQAPDVPVVQPVDSGPPTIGTPDIIRIELGYSLLELANGGTRQLPEQVRRLRRALASELGFILPSVRIQDNIDLGPNDYTLLIKEISAGTGEVRPTQMLAISPDGQAPPLPGEPTTEPTFGLPAYWIQPPLSDQARLSNYTVVDPATVLTTHLAEVVKDNVAEILSYAETQKLLAGLPQDQQKLLADMVPSLISVSGLQHVLQMLLTERVSIRDMSTILEAVHEACTNNNKMIGGMVSHVRARLARQISNSLLAAGGYVPVISLSPEWEHTFSNALVGPPEDRQLALASDQLQDFLARFRAAIDAAARQGEKPALLTSSLIRQHVRTIMDKIKASVPVIAHPELHRHVRVKVLGVI